MTNSIGVPYGFRLCLDLTWPYFKLKPSVYSNRDTGIKISQIIVTVAKSVYRLDDVLKYHLRPLVVGENNNSRFLRFFVRSVPLFCSLMLTPMRTLRPSSSFSSDRLFWAMAQSMHPAGMPLKVLLNVMKTFFVFEVGYAPCKYKINSYIRVLVKWRPLADSVIVAPLADFFLQFNK